MNHQQIQLIRIIWEVHSWNFINSIQLPDLTNVKYDKNESIAFERRVKAGECKIQSTFKDSSSINNWKRSLSRISLTIKDNLNWFFFKNNFHFNFSIKKFNVLNNTKQNSTDKKQKKC